MQLGEQLDKVITRRTEGYDGMSGVGERREIFSESEDGDDVANVIGSSTPCKLSAQGSLVLPEEDGGCEEAYVIGNPFSSMPLFATIAFSLIGGKRNL